MAVHAARAAAEGVGCVEVVVVGSVVVGAAVEVTWSSSVPRRSLTFSRPTRLRSSLLRVQLVSCVRIAQFL
jgi:uncharacterized protein (DUF983 family)